MPDLSIIVVSWNTAPLLRRCLEAVNNMKQGPGYEVIVVDNASADSSAALVREEFPTVKLIENKENMGFARANNQAIRASRGRYVLLLNSDAFLTPGAALEMITFMDKHPHAGIAGADLYYPDGTSQASHSPLPTFLSDIGSLLGLDKLALAFQPKGVSRTYIETGVVSGACLMARRSMLDQIGLLDDNFFMYSEEVDLCYRARQAGWKIYHLPGARVIHVGSGSSGPTARRMLLLYQGKLKYHAKHYGASRQKMLLAVMHFSTWLKILSYGLLNSRNRSKVRKDEFWRIVAQGLREVKV